MFVLLVEKFEDIPADYEILGSIVHPFKKPFIRPHELLSSKELGKLWLDIAAKGRELEQTQMEEAIKSLHDFTVDDSDLVTSLAPCDFEIPFQGLPEDIEVVEDNLV